MIDHAGRNRAVFDALAPSYDAVGFLTLAAREVAAQVVATPEVERKTVLDVACGTGTVALALAEQLGPDGWVVGVDLSPEMVRAAQHRAQARAPSAAQRGPELDFQVADATHLPFADGTFDAVVCASGLFFVPDMDAALREWRRVLRPGGAVHVSSFGRGLLGPLPGLWRARLEAHGLRPGAPPLGRLPTPEAARALLLDAGLQGVTATQRELPYLLPTPQARWDEIEAGLEGLPLRALTPERRGGLRDKHLAELAPLFAAGPLRVPVPLIVARGRRTLDNRAPDSGPLLGDATPAPL